ncbi:hypothetical protein [Paenibacillus pini]|uniref:Uncharacterized protein n=1 Tax=Paenibacillus pini JCM 16418 TaxID=1236976 RepID=W7YXL2_9BACL|nr:hypothetical protein [Paenibacillus pini]GAF07124.1 hypothetical protein JCM16418_1113 [Paenibacillus pini JCM 16418]
MKHWTGKRVIIDCNNKLQPRLKGIIRRWDEVNGCVVLGPHEIRVPFDHIIKIVALPDGMNACPPADASVSYVMKDEIQFDNAVYFHSSVMIWRGQQLIAMRAILAHHDLNTVTLDNGSVLSKADHSFVVRALRGSL